MSRRLIDLSHAVEHGMIASPGLPGPVICDDLSREASRANDAPGVEFQIGRIDSGPSLYVPSLRSDARRYCPVIDRATSRIVSGALPSARLFTRIYAGTRACTAILASRIRSWRSSGIGSWMRSYGAKASTASL